MKVEKFDEFPNLAMQEFPEDADFVDVTIDMLINDNYDESEMIMKFLLACAEGDASAINFKKIMLAKVKGGIFVAAYGPSVWRRGENVVIKSGENEFICRPYRQGNTAGFMCGALVGELMGLWVKYTEDGSNTRDIQRPVLRFYDPQDEEGDEYHLPLWCIKNQDARAAGLIGPTTVIDYPCLAGVLKKKGDLLPFIASAPGGSFIKMSEIGPGEYAISHWEPLQSRYGISYKIHLKDGRIVLSNSKTTKLIVARGDMMMSAPYRTLVITDVEKLDNGKYSANGTIFLRPPKGQDGAINLDAIPMLQPEKKTVSLPAAPIEVPVFVQEVLEEQAQEADPIPL